MTLVLVGLGSNQGDSVAVVRHALVALGDFAAGEVRASALFRTTPVDCPPGSPDFVNAVAAFEARTGLTPEMLIAELKRLERASGRCTAARHAPRILDLDLLLFGDEMRAGPELTLPHPRAMTRRFVLVPAAQVAPDVVWPGTGCTVAEWLERLESDEVVEELAPRS